MPAKKLEYRICWAASSNISFRGNGSWRDASDWGESDEEVQDALSGEIPDGLKEAMNSSGFEWWVETREVSGAS
jgi:hypothetical protein